MLSKFGYTPGSKLGATNNQNGVLEPLMIEMKEGKEGVGMANEKKRKFREEVEEKESEQREEQEDYRERFGRERQERRTEGFLGSAMRLLEGLEEDSQRGNTEVARGTKKRVNILYRSLLRQRKEQDHERRIRYNLLQSLSKNAAYDEDADDEKQDRLAWGKEEEDSDEEDEELDAFEALDPLVRLQRLVQELREKHWYCFWCKHRYENEEMEGCPGVEEDDHN